MATSSDPYAPLKKAAIEAQRNGDFATAAALQQSYNQQMSRILYNNPPRSMGMAQNYVGNMSALQNIAQAANVPIPQQTMNPTNPQFENGQKVTVRGGKTVWTIIGSSAQMTPQSPIPVWYYQLTNEANSQTGHEPETDIKLSDSMDAKAKVDFETVVIADHKRQQILEALEQVNQQDLIFKVWGFGETIEKGKGVSLLFYGPPGTGKTLMAQAIANKLEATLKIISTADIESSAPGEAERNIRKHFKDAKGGKTILLFDECDSLIHAREHTGPIMAAQINELLSQIERFNGVTVFTTNRLGTLDEAVNRRLALKLEFEMPSLDERALIWQRMIPKQAPLDKKIDWLKLASIEVTGGYIKNAVLRAARMAAIQKMPDDKKKIRMEHLVQALKLETESMIKFQEARRQNREGYGRVVGKTTARGHGGIQVGHS